MRHPITFLIAVIILATAAIVFVLLTPEARLWVERLPLEITATVAASAGMVTLLLAAALADAQRQRRSRNDWAAVRRNEALALAAAVKGELAALGQWLDIRASALENAAPDNPLRSNLDTDVPDVPDIAARIVYEANASRLGLLGPDLAAAIAYCHTSYDRAEQAMPRNGDNGYAIRLLRNIENKFDITIGYLESFAAGKPVAFKESDRKILFADLEPPGAEA